MERARLLLKIKSMWVILRMGIFGVREPYLTEMVTNIQANS